MLRFALLLLTFAVIPAADMVYPTVTIANAVAEVTVSSQRGSIDRFALLNEKTITLPTHLQREVSPGKGLAVLGPLADPAAPVSQGVNQHNWLANDTAAAAIYGLTGADFAPWTIVSSTTEAVTLTATSGKGLSYQLTYRMDPTKATVAVHLEVRNATPAALALTPYLIPFNGIHQDYGPNEVAYLCAFWHQNQQIHSHTLPSAGTLEKVVEGPGPDYLGLKSRFFAAWMTPGKLVVDAPVNKDLPVPTAAPVATGPGATASGPIAVPGTAPAYRVDVRGYSTQPHLDHQGMLSVTWATQQVPPGGTLIQEWSLSAASMTKVSLATLSDSERRIEVTDSMHKFFLVLTNAMTKVLSLIQAVVVNYGVAVLLLTLLVKAAMYKLTYKQHASMLKMQKVAPELKLIQEQYKDDKQKLAAKQMELWKKHGVNPLGGCLPMLIQIPIFLALYQAFQYSADMRGASFLWVPDLTLPDQIWGMPIAFLNGWILSVNPLPLVYIAVTIWTSLSMPMPTGGDPQQEQMAKTMRWMPVIFGVIFYNMPAGLVLYFTANAILSTLEVKFIRRRLGMA